ncbi:MAG: hypothetical protein C0598_00285 [Marinilabiliales bacterium]|nr:MAG: hypothetical protein C0598_00285 [Marinilabiliales bacterium]
MKKIYLLAISLFVGLFTYSQSMISEDFSGNMPPSGWSIDGFSSQWTSDDSENAGGTAPEAHFTYTSSIGVSRLVSPEVDLSGYSSVTLRFKHFYDNYSGTDPVLGVATRSGGGDWNVAWEIGPSGDVGPETQLLEIDNSDVGATDFQFCIYIDGNFYNMDNWYIDDVELYIPYSLDAELTSINTAPFVSGATEVSGTVSNFSENFIVSLDINWQVADGPVNETSLVGLAIGTGDSYDFVLDQLFDFPIGSYDLNVWITGVNGGDDDFEGNNSLTKTITVVSNTTQRTPLFEEFTSATCAPCASFNSSFVPWCETNADDIALIKYQMNWPGSGDIYYTEEGGQRRGYYGVSYVPWLVGDGSQIETSISAVNSFFNSSLANPSFVSLIGTHSVSGTTIDITATVLPFANFENALVHIIVFEKLTTGNVGSNGETEFEHVMMKMVPDASGTIVEFTDRQPVTFTEQVDLANTNVEEFDDLGVIIIVQDLVSASVYQAGYTIEDAVFGTDARLDMVEFDGTQYSDFDSDIFEYNIELPDGTVDVPVVTGIPMEETSTVVVVPATELPGTTVIDVFAEDLSSHNTYTFNFTVAVGVDEIASSKIKLYPNPNNGQFHISGLDANADINIYNVSGKKLYEFENVNSKVDVSGLVNGIYFIQIITEEGIVSKRFTINK